ncbi:unnamed protein product [Cylindrotheca closterium]|uniref:Protein kinase domain-containing protein n=1 Tax=Cylindrotheca closterium TaxID=2856 RepID=A0AAD2FRB1_9STRA|nr:unnamed protein product [Cylindrotheca closterium]
MRQPASSSSQEAYELARDFHEQSFEYSRRPDLTSQYPRVSLEDLQKTQLLGSGAFATVVAVRVTSEASLEQTQQKRSRQVSNISSCSTQIIDCSADDELFGEEDQEQQQQDRYALKQLKSSLDQEDLHRAVADLVTEARLLAEINHPHIVRLRAISSGPKFDKGFFIVIDRFRATLVKRIEEWKMEEKHISGLKGRMHDWNGHRRTALFQERLRAARDLGSALQYLHENRIVFRDLKEENVAFDKDGQIQLFDFGLAKELPKLRHKDDLYNMTPHTGTLKYMAPEVALGQPYNESCDVYSFAILLWEMLSLKRAFSAHTNKEIEESVVRPPFKRPTRNQSWPQELSFMMHKAWSPRICDRPSSKEMELMLMDLCLEDNLQNKRHSIVVHKSLSIRKSKLHLFHHKRSGHSDHHQHPHQDTDDCCSSSNQDHENEDPLLSVSVH